MSTWTSPSWHCDDEALAAFAAGTVDPISGSSVETHLMTCEQCRTAVSQLFPKEFLDEVWDNVREQVEAPAPGPVERLLAWLGVSKETARLLELSVPAMQGAWLAGLFCATGFAALATTFDDNLGLVTFLLIAPMAPLAGVAASFGGDARSRARAGVGRAVLSCAVADGALCGSALHFSPPHRHRRAVNAGSGLAGSRVADPGSRSGLPDVGDRPVRIGHTITATVLAATWSISVRGRRPDERPAGADRTGSTDRMFRACRSRSRGRRSSVSDPRHDLETAMSSAVLSNVSKRFGRTQALDGVDLTLATGVTGLLGPNGAGKTTLLRILVTALGVDTGEVVVLGEDPTTARGRVAIRRRLGYVPQETGFPRGFTVFGFVDYMAILKEWSVRSARHTEVRRVIDTADLTAVAAKRVKALSGGQRRRVVLAQALLGRPDLLVLDEPTAGLDPEQRRATTRHPEPGRTGLHRGDLDAPDR